MIGRIAFAALVAASLGGCVSTPEKVSFVAGAQQQSMLRDGRSALVSEKRDTSIVLGPAARGIRPGGRPVMVVGIRNKSKKPIDFRLADVTVHQLEAGRVIKDLPVVTYEQLVSEERGRQVLAAILVGVAAGANSYAAASYRSPVARAIATGNANFQNQAMINNAVAAGELNMAALESAVIKDNTFHPGEWYGGQLFIEPPERLNEHAKNYMISIALGGETHQISVVQGDGTVVAAAPPIATPASIQRDVSVSAQNPAATAFASPSISPKAPGF